MNYNLTVFLLNEQIDTQFYSKVSDNPGSPKYFKEELLGLYIWLPDRRRVFYPWTAIAKLDYQIVSD